MSLKDRKLKIPPKAQESKDKLQKELDAGTRKYETRKTIRDYDDEQGQYDDMLNQELDQERAKQAAKVERNRRRV